MPISATSRYAQSTVVPAQNLDGTDILAIVFTPPTDTTITFTYHQVTGNDYVDVLANRYYGDPTLWWVIANANPEVTNWTSLIVGSLLRIPNLQAVA